MATILQKNKTFEVVAKVSCLQHRFQRIPNKPGGKQFGIIENLTNYIPHNMALFDCVGKCATQTKFQFIFYDKQETV